MATLIPARDLDKVLKEQTSISFYQSMSDSGHYIVHHLLPDGSRETIGNIYVEVDGDEVWYFSTNRKGREIFTRTTDFNQVEMKFERYARLFKIQREAMERHKKNLNVKKSQFKNQNIMNEINNESKPEKRKWVNQLIFIEYEKETGDGHKETVVDSSHSTVARIYRSFNDETKRNEYAAFDHKGNLMFKKDKLWEVKRKLINNREMLLEEAHQRRIAAKEKAIQRRKEQMISEKSPDITEQPSKSNSEKSKEQERQDELSELRGERDTERGEMERE